LQRASGVPELSRPLVSIITPAYNAEPYLIETVESVLNQTMGDFELLIVDDGSTDGTLSLAMELAQRDDRIDVTSGPNRGPAAARNDAMRRARGRFFALLDSDDRWFPDYLSAQLRILDGSDAAIVTVNAISSGGPHDGQPLWPEQAGLKRLTLLDVITHENWMCIMSIFRRELVDRIGGFDPGFTGNEDYEFWLRAAQSGAVIIQNCEPHGWYRRREGSLSSDDRRMLDGILSVFRHVDVLCDRLPIEHAAISRQIRRFETELAILEVREALRKGEATKAAHFLKVAAALREDRFYALAAEFSALWAKPLLWAYQLRQSLRTHQS
jgi:teichuronic acid biosynthesis glycosyltransferase TuaG